VDSRRITDVKVGVQQALANLVGDRLLGLDTGHDPRGELRGDLDLDRAVKVRNHLLGRRQR
jgi:hypothetical protein